MKTEQEQIEEISKVACVACAPHNCCPLPYNSRPCEAALEYAKAVYDAGYRKVENVYIIVSAGGGIALNICTGKGTVYNDKAKAEEALRRKNEWAKTKGYGIYELVELEVEYDKCNC